MTSEPLLSNQNPDTGSKDQNVDTQKDEQLDRAKVAGAFKDLLTPANIFLLALVVILLLTGLLGGWNNLSESKRVLPVAETGKDIEVNPFRIQVRKAMWFTNFPQMFALRPGQRGLVVTMDVTNISDSYISVHKLEEALRLEGLQLVDHIRQQPVASEKAVPYAVRGSDGFPEQTLQPGLPVRLGLVWVQDIKTPAPRELDMALYKQTYRQSSLDGSMDYFDRQPVYKLTMPLTELKVPQ